MDTADQPDRDPQVPDESTSGPELSEDELDDVTGGQGNSLVPMPPLPPLPPFPG